MESIRAKFKQATFYYLPREENQLNVSLATLALMVEISAGVKITPLVIKQRDEPSYKIIAALGEEDALPWYLDIWNFIDNGEYRDGASNKDKKAIRKFLAQFIICAGRLWKKSCTGYNLECSHHNKAKRIMEEIHEGVCGPHTNWQMLSKKIIR